MAVQEIPRRGLKVPLGEYTQLKAFQGGGYFGDVQPQQIIRHTLGEFLPEVKRESDNEGAFGLFSQMVGDKEVLSRSKPIGKGKIPASLLEKLNKSLEELNRIVFRVRVFDEKRIRISQVKLGRPPKSPPISVRESK